MQLFQGLRGVKQSDLPAEILAGVTLVALIIPLNIGYAQVAGLPATVGLYSAILPLIAYVIFCTSRQVVASPDAAIAALLGSSLPMLATPNDPRYLQLAYAVAILCALILFLFWFFKFRPGNVCLRNIQFSFWFDGWFCYWGQCLSYCCDGK